MLTGRHNVRDVYCKNCESKLGWFYEYATDEAQVYKEGKTILERALVTEKDYSHAVEDVVGGLHVYNGRRGPLMRNDVVLRPGQ